MLRNGLIFLACVIVVYAIAFAISPTTGAEALTISVSVLSGLLLPICLVFVALVLTNLFLRPRHVAGMLGRGSGLRGSALALLAGIVSTGPAYAWYSLLATIRREGGGAAQIAVFLFGRSIKPFLWPAMLAYFGVLFVVLLNVLIVAGAFAVGWITERLPVHDSL